MLREKKMSECKEKRKSTHDGRALKMVFVRHTMVLSPTIYAFSLSL